MFCITVTVVGIVAWMARSVFYRRLTKTFRINALTAAPDTYTDRVYTGGCAMIGEPQERREQSAVH